MGRTLALALAMTVVAGCSTDPAPTEAVVPPNPWGPLAVSMGGNGMKALTGGTLGFTETCTFVERDGERRLLIWSAAQTSWDSPSRTIVFQGRDGAVHRLAAGQPVSLGGGGFSAAEDGRPVADFLAATDWASPPRPECVTPVIWVVSGVVSP